MQSATTMNGSGVRMGGLQFFSRSVERRIGAIIALLVLGPKRLPDLARFLR